MCLGMALPALILGFIPSSFIIYEFRNTYSIGIILSLVLPAVGLILAVLSSVYSSKAKIHEPYNRLQKAGNDIGKIAICFNSIGMLIFILGILDVRI